MPERANRWLINRPQAYASTPDTPTPCPTHQRSRVAILRPLDNQCATPRPAAPPPSPGCDQPTHRDWRDLAILLLLLDTGMRLGELAGLAVAATLNAMIVQPAGNDSDLFCTPPGDPGSAFEVKNASSVGQFV